MLVFEGEAQLGRVERDRPGHVSDLISHSVHTLDESVLAFGRLGSPGGSSRGIYLTLR
jgi:hypothetical protein